MSQLYIANINLGDQSSSPSLQASLTADMTEPVTCASLFCSAQEDVFRIQSAMRLPLTNLSLDSFDIDINSLYEIGETLYRLRAQRTLSYCQLKPGIDGIIEIRSFSFPVFYGLKIIASLCMIPESSGTLIDV